MRILVLIKLMGMTAGLIELKKYYKKNENCLNSKTQYGLNFF